MLCWDGVVEMWGVLGQGCPPAWGAAHSLAERGVFIYYLWRVGALPGHGGGRRTVLVLVGHRGCHQGLTSTSWLCLCPERGWQGHSCGRWLWERARGWWPWDHGHVPSGDTEVSRGSISTGEHPTLSPGFPSPPCAAVQPFGSGSPSPGHWGWDRRGGGSGVPLGRAGDALSLLLPFNKLVFL